MRIFIVEDHKDMQAMYAMALRKRPDLQIIAQVETAEQALALLPQSDPDLVIIDVSLPGMDGIALTREVRKLLPNKKILIASGHDASAVADQAIAAGANDFIEKGDGRDILEKIDQLNPPQQPEPPPN